MECNAAQCNTIPAMDGMGWDGIGRADGWMDGRTNVHIMSYNYDFTK